MLKIGLTGGIGSGKSTVALIFEVLGTPVYYADVAAKRLMNEDDELKASIVKSLGENAYINGCLNREYVAMQVFNDEEKIKTLNAIVHPATIKDAEQWFQIQKAPYVIKEAALIFESGSNAALDYVIGVQAPESLRMERAMQRDHITAEEVKARMNKQMNEEEKIDLCDFVIINDEQQGLLPQTLALHKKLLLIAQKETLIS